MHNTHGRPSKLVRCHLPETMQAMLLRLPKPLCVQNAVHSFAVSNGSPITKKLILTRRLTIALTSQYFIYLSVRNSFDTKGTESFIVVSTV